MADKSEKAIEDIKVGDEILSVNIKFFEIEVDTVVLIPETQKTYNRIEIIANNGIVINCSPHHPIYVIGKGWSVYDVEMAKKDVTLEVEQLAIDDIIIYYKDGKLLQTNIVSMLNTNEKVKMYNVEHVKKNNTFFANKILVHNRFNTK